MKHLKEIWNSLAQLRQLHRYSRDILRGTMQMTSLLYIIAYVAYRLAPQSPDYFKCMTYYASSLEIAPVVFAVGVIAALVCDLVMRKNGGEPEPADKSRKDKTDADQDK